LLKGNAQKKRAELSTFAGPTALTETVSHPGLTASLGQVHRRSKSGVNEAGRIGKASEAFMINAFLPSSAMAYGYHPSCRAHCPPADTVEFSCCDSGVASGGAFFRRLKSRKGTPKAITVTVHKLARLIYAMPKHGDDDGHATMTMSFSHEYIHYLQLISSNPGFRILAELVDFGANSAFQPAGDVSASGLERFLQIAQCVQQLVDRFGRWRGSRRAGVVEVKT
jgi:hypothetical protein